MSVYLQTNQKKFRTEDGYILLMVRGSDNNVYSWDGKWETSWWHFATVKEKEFDTFIKDFTLSSDVRGGSWALNNVYKGTVTPGRIGEGIGGYSMYFYKRFANSKEIDIPFSLDKIKNDFKELDLMNSHIKKYIKNRDEDINILRIGKTEQEFINNGGEKTIFPYIDTVKKMPKKKIELITLIFDKMKKWENTKASFDNEEFMDDAVEIYNFADEEFKKDIPSELNIYNSLDHLKNEEKNKKARELLERKINKKELGKLYGVATSDLWNLFHIVDSFSKNGNLDDFNFKELYQYNGEGFKESLIEKIHDNEFQEGFKEALTSGMIRRGRFREDLQDAVKKIADPFVDKLVEIKKPTQMISSSPDMNNNTEVEGVISQKM